MRNSIATDRGGEIRASSPTGQFKNRRIIRHSQGAEVPPSTPAVLHVPHDADTASNASRQHYIDTGRFLSYGEAYLASDQD